MAPLRVLLPLVAPLGAALLALTPAAAEDEETPVESFENPQTQLDGSTISTSTDGDPDHYLIRTPDGALYLHWPDGRTLVQAPDDCPGTNFLPRQQKECRGPDADGDYWIYEVEYLEYACPKPPPLRRIVISVVDTGKACSEGAYYRERELAKDRFGEKWPRPPEKDDTPPPKTEEKTPPSFGTGKVHNPLATTDCLQKRLWELWFKAFAEGKTPKGDVDIPLVPWSRYSVGADGTGTFESPEGSVLEKRPDGSVWEKKKGGAFKQICKSAGPDGAGQPKTGEPPKTEPGKPADKPGDKPAGDKPAGDKPADDKTGQGPVQCPPGLLADTLNDLLGSDLQGICYEPDEGRGNAEGGEGEGEGGGED
jgi:hypothetical protein